MPCPGGLGACCWRQRAPWMDLERDYMDLERDYMDLEEHPVSAAPQTRNPKLG